MMESKSKRGPCVDATSGFISLLIAYEKAKADGKSLEIIFVSSDKRKNEYEEYFSEMPWMAVPFENQQLPRALMLKHSVVGIPSLVMYDEDGKLITRDAVTSIRFEEPFPWSGSSAPPTLKLKDISPLLIIVTSAVVWFCWKKLSDYLRSLGYNL